MGDGEAPYCITDVEAKALVFIAPNNSVVIAKAHGSQWILCLCHSDVLLSNHTTHTHTHKHTRSLSLSLKASLVSSESHIVDGDGATYIHGFEVVEDEFRCQYAPTLLPVLVATTHFTQKSYGASNTHHDRQLVCCGS
jgi:hypothetical protein